MTTMTLSVNDELKQDMDLFPQINWSAVARAAFAKQVAQLKLLRELTKDSELTEEDAIRIGREIKHAAIKRHPEWFGKRR
jgi:hypothetical protein